MPLMPCDEFKLYYSWYCCLAPLESAVLTGLIALRTGALVDFVLKAHFDDTWTLAGGQPEDTRYGMFVFVYHMRLETIEYEGTETEVYFIDDEWWFKWLLFVGCPSWVAGCSDCFERNYSL